MPSFGGRYFKARVRRLGFVALLTFLLIFPILFIVSFLMVHNLETSSAAVPFPRLRNLIAGEIVDFSVADNITGFTKSIVPNVVHFIKFRSDRISFTEMVNIKAVHLHQKPDKIIIHCSCRELVGKYWEMIRNLQELEVSYLDEPTHVFGKPLSSVHHASDVARIQLMMERGGIFLDNDVYVVRSLDFFRKFEFSIGWPVGENIGTQVLIGHKNARFLKKWLQGYKWYRPFKWYYNAGQLPTDEILKKEPGLVHRVPLLFGVHYLIDELYKRSWPEWKEQYTVHLLVNHRDYLDSESAIQEFNEVNIRTYDRTYGEMARLVLYGKSDILPEK